MSSPEEAETPRKHSTEFSVEDYQEARQLPIGRVAASARQPKNWAPWLGLLGTIIIHMVAIPFVHFGASDAKQRESNDFGNESRQHNVAASSDGDLIIINVPTASTALTLLNSVPMAGFELDALPAAEAAPGDGDPSERAEMFGRYLSQISARVERAWKRPRSPIAAGTEDFRCQVQIRQDSQGYVQETLLLDCNGTEAWRHSLVTAIDEASPLPAPPIPSVYIAALTMTFNAHEYNIHDDAGDYETLRPVRRLQQ